MASSWRYAKRGKFRSKVSQDSEDYYRLDPKKTFEENCFDIYKALCCSETRDTKRLFLLNGLTTLCQQQEQQNKKRARIVHLSNSSSHSAPTLTAVTSVVVTKNNLGFSTEELLYCLSASLIHTFTQVRAASLRTIRYVLATTKDIKVFNAMQLPYLLCRSIDLMLKNDDERVQALKLIRKMLAISADNISPVLVRCLVSLADTGIEESDNMLRACLATLCEFAVLNPTLLICCGGVTSITRNVLECHNPRIAESLSGVLLYLLEWPQTRSISGVRLDCLAAPYCDFTYRLGIMDKNKNARELRYTSCRLALLSVLRSWTGTIEFCDPSKPSGLKAIVEALYLNQIEVRKAILELLYELLGLPQPTWTEDYITALQAVDPSDFQDNWLLSNGFVAAEGRSILPSLAACAANICEQHLALQLYCFLETGLINGLVEVIVSSETAVSIAGTVLIGKILHLMHTHLPADISSTSPALPSLITHATQGNQRASAAISALQCYQKMLRNRPASSSLFLDNIIQEGSLVHTRLFRREINGLHFSNGLQSLPATHGNTGLTQLHHTSGTLERTRLDSVSSSDESNSQSSSTRRSSFRLKCKFLPFLENIKVNRLIKDTNVLNSKNGSGWDWEVISTIIRCNLIRKLEEPNLQFLKNLIGYYKPSHNCFSHQELVLGKSLPACVKVGLDFIDWLLAISPFESIRLLTDFFTDVATQLLAVTTSNRAHDCLFSPQHMTNTMCQQYFLFIGRMCRSQKGISILTNTAVFENLINLVRNTVHVCYVKLIVSGLDYTLDSVTRKVLESALTSAKTRSGRLYSTQFLIVLLRSRIPNFEVWGIPLIIQQTKDPDRSVVLAAMDVLEEACHEKYYLEEIVSLWPNLKSLGDIGRVLMARYYSLSRGLNQPKARVKEEIDYWKNGYNKRYVLLVEADTHSSLTLHFRNEDGFYSRRNCNTRSIILPPNIPAHLYGQMVQTTQGTTALKRFGDLTQLIEIIVRGKCSDETECLELKAALWAIAHASTHSNGIELLLESGTRIFDRFVYLATKCEVYSVRATCFNSLGVIGSTSAGANILFKLNWLSVRHDRNTIWPVHHPEDWMLGNYTPVRHHYEDMPPYNYSGLEDQIDGSYYTGSYWNLLLSSNSTNRDAVGAASGSSEIQDANTTTDSIKTSGEEFSGDNISQPTKFGSPRVKTEKTASKQVVSTSTSISYNASGSGNVLLASAKAKTLPESSYLRHSKHQRSLSESKTTDAISILSSGTGGVLQTPSTGIYHSHRIRYNSCTDSNTSGVSSCESVAARPAPMGEFQQFPLSPIPSMSNLLEISMGQSSLLRRTSLVRTSYLQNVISPVDIKGYAQLRSLRRHCRPVLSESAAELYDIVDRMELLSFASFRPRKSSFGDSQRKIKVRSLDRQTSLRMYQHLDSEELQVPLPSLNAPKFLSQNDSKGPCYAGISLPKNLLDMFPTRNLSRTYVSQDIQDQDLMECNLQASKHNDSLYNEGEDESSVMSSLSDVSSVSKRSKWSGPKHGRSNCLSCCRLRKSQRSQNQTRLDGRVGDLSSTTSLCEMYTNASAAIMAAGIQATIALARRSASSSTTAGGAAVSSNKQTLHQHHNQQQQLSNNSSILLSDLQFQSPESILSEESLPDKLTANILYNVQRLGNPVSAKQSKMALLELKQKHPTSFQDICLYSEVCRTLGRSSYRMNARRFLQELFLDLDFESFFNQPLDIINRRQRESLKNSENKEKSAAIDKLSLLKERMKRDLNSPGNRLDNNPLDSRIESIQSATTGSNNVIVLGSQTLKGHIKSQPLASVYEASCENLLLDPSPRLKSSSISGKIINSKQNVKICTIAPPQASIAPLNDYNTELRITSDDDDGDSGSHFPSSQIQVLPTSDETIGAFVRSSYSVSSLNPASSSILVHPTHSTTPFSYQNNYLQAGASLSTPNSSGNCSDQTTTSNRSSICTISHQPYNSNNRYLRNSTPITSPSFLNPIENENTKFRRGRFYTLELDLSCTKNKFPITDRAKTNNHSTFVSKTVIEKSPTGLAPSFSSSIKSPTKALQRQYSLGGDSYHPVTHLSYTTGLTSLPSTTVTNVTSSSMNHHNPKYLITKSLAASLAQPFGTLYCEKRLQLSKSEAVLIQNTSITTVTSGSLPTTTKASKVGNSGGSNDASYAAINKISTISNNYEKQS